MCGMILFYIGAGYYPNSKTLLSDDVIEQPDGREEIERSYEQSPECILEIYRQEQSNRQVNLCILYQFYSEDLENTPSFTLHDQERRASIVELESSRKAHGVYLHPF